MGCCGSSSSTVPSNSYPRQGFVPAQPGMRTNPMTGYPQGNTMIVQQGNNSDRMMEGVVMGAAIGYGAHALMHDGGHMVGGYGMGMGMGAMMPTCDVNVGPIDVI